MTIDPIPSWLNPVPFGDVGRGELPGDPQQRGVLSEDQLQQMRNQLLESILSSVVQAVRGLFIPGPFGAALQQLEEWAADLPGSFAAILAWIEEQTGLNFADPVAFINSLVQKILTTFQIDLGSPEDLFGSIQSNIGAVFTTIGGVLAWIEEQTGLNFADPVAFINSLVQKITDDFQINLGSPEDLFNSIQSNIGAVFTTLGGVLAWIQEKTGLDFTDPPEFLSSLVTKLVEDVEGFVTGVSNALWSLTGFANSLWVELNEATELTWDAGPLNFINSFVQKITDDFQINLGSPEDLFNSIQSNIGAVFTTIGGVLAWVENETGLNFSEGPENFILSLINTVLDGFGVNLNGPYELWTSIVSPLETILGLGQGEFTNFLGNLTVFFNGLPNIFDGVLTMQSAVQFFLTETLGIAQIGAAGLQFVESLIPDVLGVLDDFFDNIASFLGIDLRLVASGNFLPEVAFATFLTNIRETLLAWINYYIFGGVQNIGQWVEANIFGPIGQTLLSGLKLDPGELGITDVAQAGLGVLGDIAGTLLTSLTAIPATLLEGILPPGLLGQIPVSNISETSPNLINLGSFAEAGNIEAAAGWSWDANNNSPGSSGGSAKLVISTAKNHHLYSRQAVPVGEGDRLVLSAKVMTSGLTVSPSGSTPIYISLIPFIGTSQQSAIPVGTARGSTTSWNSIGNTVSGPYVVTNANWTSVIVRLTVASTATAGTVWWDEVSLTKTGKLVQGNVDSLIDAWNSMIGGLEGLGENVSGFDWTRLFTAASNARQQGTTAQSRLDNTNTNLFGTPLGGTTFAPDNLPTLISNLAAIKVDGSATMSGFLDGLLEAFGGQIPPGALAAAVADVTSEATALTSIANTANEVSGTAAENIQLTWDNLYDAFAGSTGSLNRTSGEVAAVADQVRAAAAVADGKAQTAQDAIDLKSKDFTNLAAGSDFEGSHPWTGLDSTMVVSSAVANTGSKSLRFYAYAGTGRGVYLNNGAIIEAKPGDQFHAEYYAYTDGSGFAYDDCKLRFGTQTYAYIDAIPPSGLPGNSWTRYSKTITVPAGATGIRVNFAASGTNRNLWIDDIVIRKVSPEAIAAQSAADAVDARVTDAEQFLTSKIEAGANFCTNPEVEIAGLKHDSLRSTDFARTGTHSAKLVGNGTQLYYSGMGSDKSGELTFSAEDKDWFYLEFWARGNNNSGNSGYYRFFLRAQDANGITRQWLQSDVTNSALTNNWQKFSAILQINHPDVVGFQIASFISDDFTVGDSVYADSFKVIRITEAYNALLDASAAAADAYTANANAGIADAKAATADDKAVAAQESAAVAKRALNTAIESGPNIASNPGFENTDFPEGYSDYGTDASGNKYVSFSTEEAYSGSRSLRIGCDGSRYIAQAINSTLDVRVPWHKITPGDTYYVEFWLRGWWNNTIPSNADVSFIIRCYDKNFANATSRAVTVYGSELNQVTSNWVKFSGFMTIPAGKEYARLYFQVHPNSGAGNWYYFDDVKLVRVTEAYNAQQDANTAVTNAETADGKAVTAQNAADDAQAEADRARLALRDAFTNGVNMVFDGGFENDYLQVPTPGSRAGARSNEQARTGSYSWKNTLSGGTQSIQMHYLSDRNTGRMFTTSEDRRYYYEAWVFPKSTNSHANGWISLHSAAFDENNAAVTYRNIPFTTSTLTKGQWNKLSGIISFDGFPDVARWYPYLRMDGSCTSGDVFYWDDCKVIDVSEAYEADVKAVSAQSLIDARAKSGTNMVISPDFEDSSIELVKYQFKNDCTIVYDTSQKRSGTQSLKITVNVPDWNGPYLGPGKPDKWQHTVRPGDVLYASIWVKAGGNNSNTGYCGLWFRYYEEEGGSYQDSGNVTLSNTELNNDGGWVQLEAWSEVPAGKTTLEFFFLASNSTPANNVYWIDEVVLRNVTEAKRAQDAADLVAENLADAQANLDSVIAGGANICNNPEAELNLFNGSSRSTDYSRTGSYSVKLVGNGSSSVYYQGWLANSTTLLKAAAENGDWFYIEYWARAHPNNDGGGHATVFIRSLGTNYVSLSHGPGVSVANDASLKGNFYKQSGFVQLNKSGIAAIEVASIVNSSVPSGDIIYLDSVKVIRVTEAYQAFLDAETAQNRADLAYNNADTADGKAVLAQQNLDLKARDFTNLVAGSDFETTNPWNSDAVSDCYVGTSPGGAGPEGRGTKSLRFNAYTGSRGVYRVDNSVIEAKPGDQFYAEYWAYASSTFTSTDCKLRFGNQNNSIIGAVTVASGGNSAGVRIPFNTWTKLSGIINIDPGETGVILSLAASNTTGTLWIDDIVVRRITKPSEVQGLPTDISVEETLIQHSAEISDLKAAREVTVNQGKSISVNFTTMSNASSLPTTGSQRWSTRYWGSGSGAFGIVNGKAAWNSNSGSRSAQVIYLGDGTTGSEKTLTDYQTLRGVLVNPPINSPFTAIARANGTSFNNGQNPTYYVWAEAVATVGFGISVTGSLGAVINGTSMNWVTGIPLTWSTEMTLKCGVDGDPRRYQVFSGTTLVMDYKEDTRTIISGTGNQVRPSGAALSGLGSGYRRWGAIARYDGFANSGTVSSVTVSDDPPVIYAGSVARMSRSGTGNTGTIDTTLRAIPNNFFDDVDFESLDIDGNTSDGTFTVSKSKMYAITARVLLSSYTDANSFLGLQIYNGSSWTLTQYGPTMWGADTGAGAIAPTSGFALYGSFLQYLEAGEKVRLVYKQDRGSRTNILTGGGGTEGPETYFTISGMG